MSLVLLTVADPCPHYLHRAINPRVCRTMGGHKVLVFDCGTCGQRDVVDDPSGDSGEHVRQDVTHVRPTGNDSGPRGGSPMPALRGGPRGPESESAVHRVMSSTLKRG